MILASVKKEFGKLFSTGSGLKSMEEKLFVIGIATVLVMELCGLIVVMRLELNLRLFATLVVSVVLTMLDIFAAYRSNNFTLCYTALCILVNILILPFIFIYTGGFRSGIPIIMIMGFLMVGCQLDRKMRYIITAAALSVDLVLFLLTYWYPSLVTPLPEENVISSIIAAVFFCGFFSVLMMSLFMNSYRAFSVNNFREYTQKTEMRLALLESQVENIADVKRQRHNMRHHNQIIMEFAEKKDMQGLRNYLWEKQYSDEFYSKKLYCHNVTINNVLTIYAKIAESKNLEFEVKTDVDSELKLKEKELTTLISTVLENAINGAEASGKEHRKVKLNIHEKGHRLIVNCSNTCADDLPRNENYPGVPGSGIEEVERILDENGGVLDYEVGADCVNCRMIVDAI